jgi:YjjI family glycine radical enzyme
MGAIHMDEFRSRARAIVNDPTLTYHQRRHYLAGLAEEALEPPALSDDARDALHKRIVCDLLEGNAPYRPRYILPDYAKALAQGSEFLELDPPIDLDEALNFLLILYSHIPSITSYPVYLGDLDKLLAPYVDALSDDDLHDTLRLFWRTLDRMFPDAFTHTDLGPDDSRIGRTIFQIERELTQVVPNITFKVDPDRTPDDYVREGILTVFEVAKPHFVNHPLMVRDLGEDYAAVSCYNSLKVGGGSHTLVRLNLKEAALQHRGSPEEFLTGTLPRYVALTTEVIESRIRYLVDEARFFEHDFLAREGLIDISKFSAMFGVFGLAECVDVLGVGTYGHDSAANELSYRIIDTIAGQVAATPMPYCEGNGGACFLHAQSGIDTDVGVTAGTRIAIGAEPGLYEHIRIVAPHHDRFSAGVSDVFQVEDTVVHNPKAMVDVIRGAFHEGMRDFTFNVGCNDFVRITGYLVRKSDLDRFAESGARHNSTSFGFGAETNTHVTTRNVKRIMVHERTPRAPE